MSTPFDLDALEQLHAATTPGPWRQCRPCGVRRAGCDIVWAASNRELPLFGGDDVTCSTNADAAFIAAAHEAVPALIAEVRRLRRALERVRETLTSVEPR